MLNKEKLIESFRACLGFPYVSPGTNDSRGIDCSGMFVRAYSEQHSSIYHGSNTIWRKHLSSKGKITKDTVLCTGMAVFKNRKDGNEPSRYRQDGEGNFYHIGLVVGVDPVRIIHASTKATKAHPGGEVREDEGIGTWSYWGQLADVDYSESEGEKMVQARVQTNGGSLNLRSTPNTSGSRLEQIPNGELVDVISYTSSEWWKVRYKGKTGYCSTSFLVLTENSVDVFPNADAEEVDPEPEEMVTFSIPKKVVLEVFDKLREVLN